MMMLFRPSDKSLYDLNVYELKLYRKNEHYLYKIKRFFRIFRLILGLLLLILILLVIILLTSFAICNIIFSIKSHVLIKWDLPTVLSRLGETGYVNLLTSIIALTALSGPAIAYYWNMMQSHRHELNLSYDFFKEWRGEKISSAIYNVRKFFYGKDLFETGQILFAATNEPKNHQLLVDVRTLLNFFESIAAACNKKHLNEEMMKRYFEYAFERYYIMFLAYIYSARTTQPGLTSIANDKNGVYYDFTQLTERWIAQRP